MTDTGLTGRVVLVTGGNHGIGAATAKAFASEGALVFVQYLRVPAETSATSRGDPAEPGEALYQAQIEHHLQKHGSVDRVIIHCRQKNFGDSRPGEFQWTNYGHTFYCYWLTRNLLEEAEQPSNIPVRAIAGHLKSTVDFPPGTTFPMTGNLLIIDYRKNPVAD